MALDLTYRLIVSCLHTAIDFYGGMIVEGRSNVPRNGGLLLVSNHRSLSDPPVILSAIPRPVRFMARDYIFKVRWIGPVIQKLGAFPVSPDGFTRAPLRRAVDLLKAGEVVGMFPEGRITETGSMLPFTPGALQIARLANVPILPVGLQLTERLVPYGKTVPQRAAGKAIIRIGTPVTMDVLTGGVMGKEGMQQAAVELECRVRILAGEKE